MSCSKKRVNKILNTMLAVSLFLPAFAFSSVTMMGSRIIYPSDAPSMNVEFSNKDLFPYVVQTWLDDGDNESTPVTGKAPFIASPAIFKIASNNGQVLRISYTGQKNLPQDRESLFYFNFLQIPPVNAAGEDSQQKNKMLVMLKNRIKVFYRPVDIAQKIGQLAEHISVTSSVKAAGTTLQIKNNSPFYLSIASVKIKNKNKIYSQPADMLAPFSQGNVEFKKMQIMKNDTAVIEYVNDQGAIVSYEYGINP